MRSLMYGVEEVLLGGGRIFDN